MANYDSIDFDWSWDGDIDVDHLGDLKDTKDNYLKAIADVVQCILKSDTFDWEKDPLLGANLSDFQGEPNTRDTGKAIEERIRLALLSHKTLQSGDFRVRVVPVHNNQVLISIVINTEATIQNGLVAGNPLQLSLIYDTLEDSVFFLLTNNVERSSK